MQIPGLGKPLPHLTREPQLMLPSHYYFSKSIFSSHLRLEKRTIFQEYKPKANATVGADTHRRRNHRESLSRHSLPRALLNQDTIKIIYPLPRAALYHTIRFRGIQDHSHPNTRDAFPSIYPTLRIMVLELRSSFSPNKVQIPIVPCCNHIILQWRGSNTVYQTTTGQRIPEEEHDSVGSFG